MFLKILGFLSTRVPQLVEIRYSFLKKLQKTMKQNNIGKFWEPFFVFCSLSLKIEYWFLKSSKYLSTVPYKVVPYKTILRVLVIRGHFSIKIFCHLYSLEKAKTNLHFQSIKNMSTNSNHNSYGKWPQTLVCDLQNEWSPRLYL